MSLELGSSDVILGMHWCNSLEEMLVNWKLLTMKFKVNETTITLQGDLSLCKSLVSLKTMLKTKRNEGQGYLVELHNLVV